MTNDDKKETINAVVESMQDLLQANPTEMFLYGYMATAASWHGFVAELRLKGYTDISTDSLEIMSERLFQDLAQLGGEQFAVELRNQLESVIAANRGSTEKPAQEEPEFEFTDEEWMNFLGNLGIQDE